MSRLFLVLTLLAGCAPRIVEVSALETAAVQVPMHRVAVIAGDSECRRAAGDLVDVLRKQELVVDPTATTRLYLRECRTQMVPLISIDPEGSRVRGWEGQSSAWVAIEDEGAVVAHLVGVSGDSSRVMPRRRAPLLRHLRDDLVRDLEQQLTPDQMVARRVYPSAPQHSARGLHTRAVRAEAQGDLEAALELALSAHQLEPTQSRAAYVSELRQRLVLIPSP